MGTDVLDGAERPEQSSSSGAGGVGGGAADLPDLSALVIHRCDFKLYGVPVVAKQTKMNRLAYGADGRAFTSRRTPPKVKANAQSLALAMRAYRPHAPFSGPVAAYFAYTFPYVDGAPKWLMADGPVPMPVRPDHDNLNKQLCDVLQAEGFLADDGRICFCVTEKLWGRDWGLDVVLLGFPKFKRGVCTPSLVRATAVNSLLGDLKRRMS